MANIDLDKMSLKELKSLKKKVEKAIDGFEERQRSEAISKLEATAREMGYSLSELTGKKAAKARKNPVAPKYRDPKNASLTWSGRGRQPQWFKDAVASGKSPDDMLIG